MNPKEPSNKVHMVEEGNPSKHASKRPFYGGKQQKNKRSKKKHVTFVINQAILRGIADFLRSLKENDQVVEKTT